jgi:prolipoprotein diacylglyceryltransferase
MRYGACNESPTINLTITLRAWIMNKIAMPTQVYLFTMPLNTYTLWVALAVMTGCVLVLWPVRHSWPAFSGTLNTLLICTLLSLLFGRAGYVLLHLDYFQEHANEIISRSSPGLWEHSMILGWLIGMWVTHHLHQHAPSNSTALLLTLAGMGASVGCIPAGCAYGREVYWTDGWLWQLRVDWPDATLINNPRLPTQLFMLTWLLTCLLIIWLTIRHRWRFAENDTGLMWVVLFGMGDFVIQFARADEMLMLSSLRAAQWADIVLILLCATILWRRYSVPWRGVR